MPVRDPKPDDPILTKLRLEHGLSLRRLGREAGLSHTRLWLLESGLPARRAERLKLAAVLGCDPDAFLPEVRHDAARS